MFWHAEPQPEWGCCRLVVCKESREAAACRRETQIRGSCSPLQLWLADGSSTSVLQGEQHGRLPGQQKTHFGNSSVANSCVRCNILSAQEPKQHEQNIV